jgi:hypothetical protein
VPAGSGTAKVTGQVFQDVAPDYLGLMGWCVDLTGSDVAGNPVTGSVLTDASGNFVFSGLSAGTYTVCEEVQSGWTQDFPPSPQNGAVCATGFGYQFSVTDGAEAGFNNFGNVPTP